MPSQLLFTTLFLFFWVFIALYSFAEYTDIFKGVKENTLKYKNTAGLSVAPKEAYDLKKSGINFSVC